jgi:hypothetical protein
MNPFRRFDQIIDEFLTVKNEHKTCDTCANAHPTQAYPQLACMFRNEFVQPKETCVRWVSK